MLRLNAFQTSGFWQRELDVTTSAKLVAANSLRVGCDRASSTSADAKSTVFVRRPVAGSKMSPLRPEVPATGAPPIQWETRPSVVEPAMIDRASPRKEAPRPGMLGWRDLDQVAHRGHVPANRVQPFDDDQAIALAFDFDWSNRNLFFEQYAQNESFFHGTPLAATGMPSPEELAVLTPLKADLP